MNDHISDSENSEVDLLQPLTPKKPSRNLSQSKSALSHRFRELPTVLSDRPKTQERVTTTRKDTIAVLVSPPSRPWEYRPYNGAATVDCILGEFEGPDGKTWYEIEFEDGKKQDVSV